MRIDLNLLKEFARDKRGNFAIMFAVLGTTLLMGTALAVDTARMFSVHNKLTFAVDAAALATTQGLTLGDIAIEDAQDAVRKYLDANLDGRELTPDTVTIDAINVDKTNRTVEIEAHTIMPMTLTGIVGYDNHRVEASSKAKFSNTEVEVAMALDITGSMNSKISTYSTKTKLQTLKDAAKDAIDTLFLDTGTEDRIRVALVPYSEAVNAAPVIDGIETTGVSVRKCSGWWYNRTCWYETQYPDCVRERTGTEKFTDHFADSTAKIGSSAYNCPSSTIQPLSEDKTALKNEITNFNGGGCTAGHIAIAWTYYLMSSKWNSVLPESAQPTAWDEPGASKYAIIMTDGEFNTFESDGYYCNSSGQAKSEDYALGLCSAMKNDGVKIYSIAFAAGTQAKNLMKSCASTDTATSTYYYDATNESGLEDAFNTIAQDIKGLRLVN